jgi:hypothetical protein
MPTRKYKNIGMEKIKKTIVIFAFGATSLFSLAQGPGGKGGMRGPLPAEQRELIHDLAQNHQKLLRKVELVAKGYTATTTSDDKKLAEKLKKHFRYMEKRLDSGAMVRRWDPAYAEMTEYYDQLEVKAEELPNGLRVTVTGTTPEAVQVARNHASIVTKFVKEGASEVEKKHKRAN